MLFLADGGSIIELTAEHAGVAIATADRAVFAACEDDLQGGAWPQCAAAKDATQESDVTQGQGMCILEL